MNQPIAYIIEIFGVALVAGWLFVDPAAVDRMFTAISNVTVSNVRVLQGRA